MVSRSCATIVLVCLFGPESSGATFDQGTFPGAFVESPSDRQLRSVPSDSNDSNDSNGSIDSSNESSGFQDTGMPPEVEFIGKAAKLRIYPGGKMDENSTWIMLTFGKIQELSADMKPVRARSIPSLASKPVVWTQETRVVGGAEALVTRMELSLEFGGNFKEVCSGGDKDDRAGGGGDNVSGGEDNVGGDKTKSGGGAGGKPRLLGSNSPSMYVAVEVFVFLEAATVRYAGEEVNVSKGELKFNIESEGWPFCAVDNSLLFVLSLKMPTDGATGERGKRSLARREKGPKAKGKPRRMNKIFRGRAGGSADVVMDFPEVAVVDNETVNSTVEMDSKGGKTSIFFLFPYFASTLLYDPTVGFEAEADTLPDSDACTVCIDDDETTDDSSSTTSKYGSVSGSMPTDGLSMLPLIILLALGRLLFQQ